MDPQGLLGSIAPDNLNHTANLRHQEQSYTDIVRGDDVFFVWRQARATHMGMP